MVLRMISCSATRESYLTLEIAKIMSRSLLKAGLSFGRDEKQLKIRATPLTSMTSLVAWIDANSASKSACSKK